MNHLEPARLDRSTAARLFWALELDLAPAQLDDGFVEYEWIGREDYLGESVTRTRAANVTSLDALMLGVRGRDRVLVVIEWKYLESYGRESVATSKRGVDRVAIYRQLLMRPDCPIRVDRLELLFYEPYYQLMRQTLLAWQMVEHREFDATDWVQLHIVPLANKRLRGEEEPRSSFKVLESVTSGAPS